MAESPARSLIERLDTEPVDGRPGTCGDGQSTLRWDLESLEVRRGEDERELAFDQCTLHLSRARLRPDPTLWQRLLGLSREPVHHVVLELRPHDDEAPIVLVAPATRELLAGLPRLDRTGDRVTASEIVEIVDAARAGGASVAMSAVAVDASDAPDTDAIASQRHHAGIRYWAGLVVGLAAVVSSLWLTLPYLESVSERRDAFERAMLGMTALVPVPALALWLARRTGDGWRRRWARGPLVCAWLALAVGLFFTVVFGGNTYLDGSQTETAITWFDTARTNRMELGLGIAVLHAGWLLLLPRLFAFTSLRIDGDGITMRRWGWWRRRASWETSQELRDLLFDRRARWIQDRENVTLVLVGGQSPGRARAALREDTRPVLERQMENVHKPAPVRDRWASRKLVVGMAVVPLACLVLGAAAGDARGSILFGIGLFIAVVAGLRRRAFFVDAASGTVGVRHTPLPWFVAHMMQGRLARRLGYLDREGPFTWGEALRPELMVPGESLHGVCASWFEGVRVSELDYRASVLLVARDDAPSVAKWIGGRQVAVEIHRDISTSGAYGFESKYEEASRRADFLVEDMAEFGWRRLEDFRRNESTPPM